jgi:hypothetical protein
VPLENAQFIHQLEPSNPAGSDQLTQGDDHLRMIKAVLKSTFPNITGPVTKDHEDLNEPNFQMPIGIISVWFGSANTVPQGWAICNGQTVSRTDGEGDITTPDLRDRTVIGAGTLAPRGEAVGSVISAANTGQAGAHSHTVSGGAHSHTGEVQGHALTVAQLPPHDHGAGIVDTDTRMFTGGSRPGSASNSIDNDARPGTLEPLTSTTGGGQAHTHGLTINESVHTHDVSVQGAHSHAVAVSTVQPSLGLHYIMKV